MQQVILENKKKRTLVHNNPLLFRLSFVQYYFSLFRLFNGGSHFCKKTNLHLNLRLFFLLSRCRTTPLARVSPGISWCVPCAPPSAASWCASSTRPWTTPPSTGHSTSSPVPPQRAGTSQKGSRTTFKSD